MAAFLSEKDAKVVGDKLGRLERPVTLSVFTQEFECDYCRETRQLAEELPGLPGAG